MVPLTEMQILNLMFLCQGIEKCRGLVFSILHFDDVLFYFVWMYYLLFKVQSLWENKIFFLSLFSICNLEVIMSVLYTVYAYCIV